jgi:hypothetical protein
LTLLEDVATTYFVVNQEPDARLEQSRVMNRVVICDSEVIESSSLLAGEDKAKLSREVLSAITVEQKLREFIEPGRLHTIEVAVGLRAKAAR